MTPLSRRDFVRAGGLALLGAGLAACGGKAATRGGAKDANPRSLNAVIDGRTQNVNVITVSGQVMARPDERFPFALFDPKSNERYTGGTTRLWVAKDQTSDAVGPFDGVWHDEGLADRGVYVARLPFAANGAWLVLVEARPANASKVLLGGTQVGVGKRSEQPAPGDKAISVATPLFSDKRGVDPICTLKPKPCSMHDISLDAALKNGKPTVLNIGTPAFCSSRICGPVVDIIDDVKKQVGSAVNFVHIEVYKDDKDAPAKQQLAPAAAAWKLEFEPATYFIAPDGTIKEWFIGPAGAEELRAQTTALIG